MCESSEKREIESPFCRRVIHSFTHQTHIEYSLGLMCCAHIGEEEMDSPPFP